MHWDEEIQDYVYAERPNKTLIKRELDHIQAVLKRMIALPQGYFDQVPMSDDLRENLVLARRIERAALQRHIRYMSGRTENEDLDLMILTMDRLAHPAVMATEKLHRAEEWRDKLIAGDNNLITELVGLLPGCDVQYLRQLIRNANAEAKKSKPPKSARLLYKYLHDLDEGE
ncbi:ribosome biogenesis factor YjgA [Leucothrix arctica]|uniref:DUF615 domain-containing protein n=1 Tax=Leucothrix arctica TaxID=1481894 RepID=A0A317CG90_9GAMM|nr:ribosome biogenesis factor YjgA [Leucothrix arctica]PWQ95242.1 hypothetical protein DKT75_12925 [Leucothrix arctica]